MVWDSLAVPSAVLLPWKLDTLGLKLGPAHNLVLLHSWVLKLWHVSWATLEQLDYSFPQLCQQANGIASIFCLFPFQLSGIQLPDSGNCTVVIGISWLWTKCMLLKLINLKSEGKGYYPNFYFFGKDID